MNTNDNSVPDISFTGLFSAGAGRSGGILFLVLQNKFDRPASEIAWIISVSDTLRLLLGKSFANIVVGYNTCMSFSLLILYI